MVAPDFIETKDGCSARLIKCKLFEVWRRCKNYSDFVALVMDSLMSISCVIVNGDDLPTRDPPIVNMSIITVAGRVAVSRLAFVRWLKTSFIYSLVKVSTDCF